MGYSIVTFDEAGFFLVPVYRRVWFFRGQKPEGVFFWSSKKANICGALIDGKKLYHDWYCALNSLTYKAFLSDFVETLPRNKKYVFLFDNASYHKSSSLKNYLNTLGKNITIEFFPPYCPELNPTETCWKIIRGNVTNSTYYPTMEDMQESIDEFLDGHFFMFNLPHYLCR